MAIDIGPKIGIEGEQTFKSSMAAIDATLKNLDAQMAAVTSSFDKNTSAEEKSARQNEIYQKSIDATKDKIKLLTEQHDKEKEKLSSLASVLEKASKEFGENSEQAQKAQNAYNKQSKVVSELETKMNKAEESVNKMSTAEKEAGANAEEATAGTKKWLEVLKGNLGADLIKSGISAIADSIKGVASACKEAVVDAAAFADDMLTLSSTTGLSTDSLQEYQYMSDLIDVSLDTVTGSMTKLTRNMSSAQNGTKSAVENFEKLGVSVTDSSGRLRDNEDVFNDCIDALGSMTNETERDALAMSIFGKSAQELNPLIEAGGDKLAELAKEANETGYVLSEGKLSELGQVQDNFDRMTRSTENLKNNLVANFAPQINDALGIVVDGFMSLPNAFENGGAEGLGQAIGNMIGNLVQYIAENAPMILDFGVGLIKGLIDGIMNTLPELLIAIVEFLPQLLQTAIELVTTIVLGIAQAAPELIPATVNALLEIVNTLTNPDNLMMLIDAAFQLIFALVEGIGASLPQLIEYVPIIIVNIVTTLITLLPQLLTVGWQLIGSLANGIGSGLSKLNESAVNIFNTIKNAISEKIVQAVQWGRDLISNFVSGIVQNASALINKIKEIAGNIKSYLGFSEPEEGPLSNFHTYAPDMMQLFADGIENNKDLISNAINDVSDNIQTGMNGINVNAMTSSAISSTLHIDGTITVDGVNDETGFNQSADYAIEEVLTEILRRQARL